MWKDERRQKYSIRSGEEGKRITGRVSVVRAQGFGLEGKAATKLSLFVFILVGEVRLHNIFLWRVLSPSRLLFYFSLPKTQTFLGFVLTNQHVIIVYANFLVTLKY